MERQFTATVYIVDGNKTLLIYHKKHQKWLPPGGHLEPNETPVEGARREALEETGLDISFLLQENVWIDRWNARSFERPYLCLLEEIPTHGNQPAHQHVDFIYVAKPTGGEIIESDSIRWFTMAEIEAFAPDIEIFVETVQTLRSIWTAWTNMN